MINLYDINNTEFNKNGDATLQPLRCELTISGINGGWQLELEVPYDHNEKWKLIKEGAIIRADIECVREFSTPRQRFRIYDYRQTLTSVVAIAYPVAMESTHDAPIANVVISGQTGINAMAALQAFTNKYTLSTDITDVGSTSMSNVNLNYAIASGDKGSFIDVWGGEIVYDNLNYMVKKSIGNSNVASKMPVIYGRNMTGIHYETDDSGLVTRIYPISNDGLRLNGNGYVDSPIVSQYPIIHSRFMNAPYRLVIDSETDNSATASATRTALAAIKAASMSPSHDITIDLISGAVRVPFDYIKRIKSGDENQKGIIDGVQDMATAEIYHSEFKDKAEKTIKAGMTDANNGAFVVADKYLDKNWTWHEDTSVTPHAWWYGYDAQGVGDSVYARNEYIKIGKYYEYFNDDGYWEEYKRLPSIDWYQNSDGSWSIGYREGYYAHNEYVYATVNGTMQEWWYDSDGWYVADSSGESDFGWHGDSSSGIWFGEEDAGSEDKSKYLHDCWAFIDGTYYFFDQYGYTDADPVHSMPDYPWDRQTDEKTGKEWFGNTDKSVGAKWLTNQWIKMGNDYYYVDANGYVRDENDSVDAVVSAYTTGLASLKTVCNTQRDTLYALLYQLMTTWCNKQYTLGIDKPTLTISVNMADLSKTTEYSNYDYLEKICLGDKVLCKDYEHGIMTEERVIGLTYDCIRGYNTNIVLGHSEASLGSILSTSGGGAAVPSGFDTTAIENAITAQNTAIGALQQNKQDKLTAGENITIVNNVISATGGGGHGLEYWTETQKKFYNTGYIHGTEADAAYKKTQNHEVGHWQNGNGWTRCMVTRISASTAPIVAGHTSNAHPMIIVASLEPIDFEWGWSDWTMDPPYGVSEWGTADTYPLYVGGYENYFGYEKETVTYNGATWYILAIDTYWWAGGTDIAGVPVFGFNYYDASDPKAGDAGLALLAAAHATDKTLVTMEIATEGDIVKYYTEEKTIIDIDEDGNAIVNEITTAAGSLTNQMAAKQNLLTAGDNIQINGDTISATDTTYEEFDGDSAGLVPAVQTPSGKFLKDDGTWADAGGGGGSANIVELTQAEYDALPSSKLSDDILYMVYFDGGQTLDPNYNYYKYGANDEIVVRVYHEGQADQAVLWFFNNWTATALDNAIPQELQTWKPTSTDPIFSDSYATVGGEQTSWVGFYSNSIRSWSIDLGSGYTGTVNAVVDPYPTSAGQQLNGYYSPYVYIQDSPPFTKIYFNTHEFTHKVTANPTDAATATLEKIEVDGIVYGVSGGGSDVLYSGLSVGQITLSKSIEDYSLIVATINEDQYSTYQLTGQYSPSLVTTYSNTSIFITSPYGLNDGFYRYKFSDNTHMVWDDGRTQQQSMVVIGIK